MHLQKTYTFHHNRILYFHFLLQIFFMSLKQRPLSLSSLTVLDLLMIALMYQQIWSSIRFHPIYSRLIIRTLTKTKVENTLTLNKNKILRWCCHNIAERENRLLNSMLPCLFRLPSYLHSHLFSWNNIKKAT